MRRFFFVCLVWIGLVWFRFVLVCFQIQITEAVISQTKKDFLVSIVIFMLITLWACTNIYIYYGFCCFLLLPSDIKGLTMLQSFSRITLLYRISNEAPLINFALSCVPFDTVKTFFFQNLFNFCWSFKISQFMFLLQSWRFYNVSVLNQLN